MGASSVFVGFVDNVSIVAGILAALLLLWLIIPKRPSNLPPGLYPWPILGNTWELSKDPRDSWPRLKEKYGEIVSVYMGSHLAIILNSYETMKEAFSSDIFTGRPSSMFFTEGFGEHNGIAASEGKLWKEQRKFGVQILRQFGLGRRLLEEKVSLEVKEFLKVLRNYKGKPHHTHYLTHTSIANVMSSILFGKRFNYTDLEIQAFLDCTTGFLRDSNNTGILNILPWLKYIPGDISKWKACLKHREGMLNFAKKSFQELKAAYDPENEPRNFVEAYLQKIAQEKDNPDSSFNECQLMQSVLDLLIAGIDTSATLLRWAMLYLGKYPDMQARIQQEIDGATGGTRSPSMLDCPELPFTEAFICETQRYCNLVPIILPHAATEDTYLRGYFIPKGTWVMPSLITLLGDKALWGDPENFRPSRFLDGQGKIIKPDNFLPFGIGKRACPGEALTRVEVFLFLSSTLQLFNLRLPEGATFPDMKGVMGVVVHPPPYEICAERR